MKRRVVKNKENQWKLRQKLKNNPQAQKAVAKEAELHHPLQSPQMHFRSSLKGLMDSETFRMSNLTDWRLSKSRWIYFQQSLTTLLPNNSSLAIPVKKGENFGGEVGVALEGSKHYFEGEQSQKLLSILIYVIYGFYYYVLDNLNYRFAQYYAKYLV